jgi:hypothetical protein
VSRYKFDRSREFIPGYKVGGGHWCSVAVQIVSEPEIYHGARVSLQAGARVPVHRTLRICLGCRSKSKKCDKQLTHIVRVRVSFFLTIFETFQGKVIIPEKFMQITLLSLIIDCFYSMSRNQSFIVKSSLTTSSSASGQQCAIGLLN